MGGGIWSFVWAEEEHCYIAGEARQMPCGSGPLARAPSCVLASYLCSVLEVPSTSWWIAIGPISLYVLFPTHDGQFQTHGRFVSRGRVPALSGPPSMPGAVSQMMSSPVLQVVWPGCIVSLPLGFAVSLIPYLFLLLTSQIPKSAGGSVPSSRSRCLGPAAKPCSTPRPPPSWQLPCGLEKVSQVWNVLPPKPEEA